MDENNSLQSQTSQTAETKVTTKCLNCGTEFHGKFCPECGQRADTQRFTIKSIFQNFILGILSNDGGVWITVKSLFTHPGQMMIDILNGKRRSYFSPFPMLFLTLSIYVIISTFTGSYVKLSKSIFDDDEEIVVTADDTNPDNIEAQRVLYIFKQTLDFADNHYSLVYILTIPVYLFSARICFGKKNRKRYNWGEYCIPMIYSLIMVVLYRCLPAIVYSFSPKYSGIMGNYTFLVNIATATACFRKMLDFGYRKMIWRSFLLMVLYWAIVILLISVGLVLVAFLINYHV